MTEKLVFDFHILIEPEKISRMTCANGAVTMIPFTGTVDSALFKGTILPGACDVQMTDTAGVKHMHASYMFEGTDYTGASCHLFVDNHGYFMRGTSVKPFETAPVLMTDSEALRDYLHSARFRGEGMSEEDCLHIRIYDVCA